MHRALSTAILGVAGVVIAVVNCGCSNIPPNVMPLAASADDLDQRVEEYGTASMSSPILTPPTPTFNFTLTGVNSLSFYNDAKSNLQSQSADFSQVANIAGVNLQAALAPGSAAPANKGVSSVGGSGSGSTGSSGTGSTGSGGTTSTSNTTTYNGTLTLSSGANSPKSTDSSAANTAPPTLPTPVYANPADAAALNASTFQGLLGSLAKQSGTTLSDRDALFQAAGDTATAAMFEVLGDQTLIAKFADKKVLLGVVTVAVNPGSRTRRGYAADISTQAQYDFTLARLSVVVNFTQDPNVDLGIRKRVAMTYGLPLPSGYGDPFDPRRPIPPEYEIPSNDPLTAHSPTVAAVAPMTQSTIGQDLNSRRAQTQLALELAGALGKAGLSAQASFFEHFAKSQQQDIDAIDVSTTVNTYTVDGGLFGFEIGPRLRPIANSTRISSMPADILDRQSFPALVIFGFDSDDIRPRVQMDEYGQMHVYEPQLRLTTITTWKGMHADLPVPGVMFGHFHRDSVYDRLSQYERFIQARKIVAEAGNDEDTANDSEAVDQYLDGLAMRSRAPAQNPQARDLQPAPLFSTGLGNLAPTAPPRLSYDLKSQLTRLDNSLNSRIHALRDDRSQRPVYHQLVTYERTVSNRIALIGLPEKDRDTAIRYLLDAAGAQLVALEASATKEVQPSKSSSQAKVQPTTPGSNAQPCCVNPKPCTAPASTCPPAVKPPPAPADSNTPANPNQNKIDASKTCVDEDVSELRKVLWGGANAIRGTEDKDWPEPPPAFDDVDQKFLNLIQDVNTLNKNVNVFVPKEPNAASPLQSDADDKSLDQKAISTALLNIGDEIRAANELCSTAFRAEQRAQDRDRLLEQGAVAAQEALFPNEKDSYRRKQWAILDIPSLFASHAPAGERPEDDNTAAYALTYTKELISKVFGAVYDAPLPASIIEPLAPKSPQVTQVVTNFVPTWDQPQPLPTDTITVTVIGKDLDAIDPTTFPKALEIKSFGADPNAADPVRVITTGFAVTPTAVTVQLQIDPIYKYPLALQFSLLGSTQVLNSPPFAISRMDAVPSPCDTVIRRITGPANDPTQQQRDELQIINAPRSSITTDLLKAKIEQDKPESRKRVDVNLDLKH
jgi:hypothetical protein